MQELQIVIHRMKSTGQIVRKIIPIETAPKMIAGDKIIGELNFV